MLVLSLVVLRSVGRGAIQWVSYLHPLYFLNLRRRDEGRVEVGRRERGREGGREGGREEGRKEGGREGGRREEGRKEGGRKEGGREGKRKEREIGRE